MGRSDASSSISLSVRNWSAWAPGLADKDAWRNWAHGKAQITGGVDPDVKFVAPMMRRRLSGLSRMAFRAAADCVEGSDTSPVFVFCSRYGEFGRSFGILEGLSDGEPVSAAAFSMSVHNTSTSLYAIETKDQSASTAIAGGEATLEAGFIEAWSLLVNDAAKSVLLIYHDEKLPDLYEDQTTTVESSAAIAMLLCLPEGDNHGIDLSLDWAGRDEGQFVEDPAVDPALQVLKLIIEGRGTFVLESDRLVWKWSAGIASD